MSAREERAREVLAAEYEREGHPEFAREIRMGILARTGMGVPLRAMLAFAADAGPGWRVVPEEPTPEMVRAGMESDLYGDNKIIARVVREVWSAMLSAAPAPDAKES